MANITDLPRELIYVIASMTGCTTTICMLRSVCRNFRSMKGPVLSDSDFLMDTAKHGNINLLKWDVGDREYLHVADDEIKTAHAIAAYNGHMEVFEWLSCTTTVHNTFFKEHLPSLFMAAAAGGQINILQWIMGTWKYRENTSIMARGAVWVACANGMTTALKYIFENVSTGTINDIVLMPDRGNEYFDTGVLDTLINHGYPVRTCAARLLQSALGYGHLDVFELLVQKYSTTYIANDCARAMGRGLIHVIKYLHQHQYDIRCDNSMILAIGSGSRELISYLHEHGHSIRDCNRPDRPDLFGIAAMDSNDFELVKWSRGYNPSYLPFKPIPYSWDWVSAFTPPSRFEALKLEQLKWLCGYGREKDVTTPYTLTDSFWSPRLCKAMLKNNEAYEWLHTGICPHSNGSCPSAVRI